MSDLEVSGSEIEEANQPNPLEDSAMKDFRTLTQRTYLGQGYVHQFKNSTTGEIVLVPCTQVEYESLSEASPTLANHIWQGSTGGTYKVDTPNEQLGLDEYCELPDGKQVVRLNRNGSLQPEIELPVGSVVNHTVEDLIVQDKVKSDSIN